MYVRMYVISQAAKRESFYLTLSHELKVCCTRGFVHF